VGYFSEQPTYREGDGDVLRLKAGRVCPAPAGGWGMHYIIITLIT